LGAACWLGKSSGRIANWERCSATPRRLVLPFDSLIFCALTMCRVLPWRRASNSSASNRRARNRFRDWQRCALQRIRIPLGRCRNSTPDLRKKVSSMSPSEQRKTVNRSRKAFAFFSETGKAGTENVYIDCPRKIQTEGRCKEGFLPGLVLYESSGLRYSPTSHGII
jgi:hypothetical protein